MRQIVEIAAFDSPRPGDAIALDVIYRTADPVDATLTGLGLRLHFDSRTLQFEEITNRFETSLLAASDPEPDTQNFDADPNTDTFINIAWADLDGEWPGTIPQRLYTARFTTDSQFDSTKIRFTASSTAAGFELDADPVAVSLATEEDLTPLLLAPFPDFNAIAGEFLSLAAGDRFTDPDGDALTFSASGLPSGLSINANTGAIAGTIAAIGEFSVTLTATDTGGATASDTFTLTVTDAPSETQRGSFIAGTLADDTLAIAETPNFDGNGNVVFAGAGDDSVNEIPDVASTNSRLYGGAGRDRLRAGRGDRLFGGTGDDILDASFGFGDNRLYGDAGSDRLVAGRGDRLIGDEGNDLLLAGLGDNTLSGGEGSDRFVLVADVFPIAANQIADFGSGEDTLEIAGVGLSFNDLQLSASGNDTEIAFGEIAIATLLGVAPGSVSSADFEFPNSAP